jgi:hypothetical protein
MPTAFTDAENIVSSWRMTAGDDDPAGPVVRQWHISQKRTS